MIYPTERKLNWVIQLLEKKWTTHEESMQSIAFMKNMQRLGRPEDIHERGLMLTSTGKIQNTRYWLNLSNKVEGKGPGIKDSGYIMSMELMWICSKSESEPVKHQAWLWMRLFYKLKGRVTCLTMVLSMAVPHVKVAVNSSASLTQCSRPYNYIQNSATLFSTKGMANGPNVIHL
jgi:hypothetical protein